MGSIYGGLHWITKLFLRFSWLHRPDSGKTTESGEFKLKVCLASEISKLFLADFL